MAYAMCASLKPLWTSMPEEIPGNSVGSSDVGTMLASVTRGNLLWWPSVKLTQENGNGLHLGRIGSLMGNYYSVERGVVPHIP